MILVGEKWPHFRARAGKRRRLRAVLEIRLPRITVVMGEGGFGERGWAVEGMKDRDPFGGQTGLEIGEGVFEGVSNGERIGSILADCGEIDAEDGGWVIGELVAKVLEGEAESDSEVEEEGLEGRREGPPPRAPRTACP